MKDTFQIIILSENAPGVLYRIAGILARRKVNIEGIHFSGTKNCDATFTLTVRISKELAEQIVQHVKRIVEVKEVHLT